MRAVLERSSKYGSSFPSTAITIWRGYLWLQGKILTRIYRRTLQTCGEFTDFGRGVYISYPSRVQIGGHCHIGSGTYLTSEFSHGLLIMGDHVQISDEVQIDFTGNVTIKKNALISARARIISHDHGYNPHSEPTGYELTIDEEAWIGFNSIILPGVTKIGKGAIIGAGSVVTKPVPEWAIVAGNPARVIKFRDQTEQKGISIAQEIGSV